MALRKRIAFGLVTIILVIAGSYLLENVSRERGLKSARIITVRDNNRVAAYVDSGLLKQLEDQQSDDVPTTGPSLLSVLSAAGINDFTNVEVTGLHGNSPYWVSKTDIGRNLVFVFTDHGTVDLFSPGGKTVLVTDVSQISASTGEGGDNAIGGR